MHRSLASLRRVLISLSSSGAAHHLSSQEERCPDEHEVPIGDEPHLDFIC
jgi:hypothetical protein